MSSVNNTSAASRKSFAKPTSKKRVIDYNYYANHTQSAVTDELTMTLSSKLDCEVYKDEDGQSHIAMFRPYLNQAEGLLRRINLSEYYLEFVIWDEDIPQALKHELQGLEPLEIKQVITEAVRRIFESVDLDYFHTNGIYKKITWRIAK